MALCQLCAFVFAGANGIVFMCVCVCVCVCQGKGVVRLRHRVRVRASARVKWFRVRAGVACCLSMFGLPLTNEATTFA